MASEVRVTNHTITARGEFWNQPWKGPFVEGVGVMSASSHGDFLAVSCSSSNRVELWDLSSHPCRMAALTFPYSSLSLPPSQHIFQIECGLLQWSHRNSALCGVYRFKTKDRRVASQDMHALFLWDIASSALVFSAW